MSEQPVTPKEFGVQFNRDVIALALDAINNHGVRHRVIDGQHFLLYNGDRSTRPHKVSASRRPEESCQSLRKWLADNVETWGTGAATPADLQRLAERYNGPTAETSHDAYVEHAGAPPTPDPPKGTWVPASLGPDKKSYGMEHNALTNEYRCARGDCDFVQTGARGAHMHSRKHDGSAKAGSDKAAATKRATGGTTRAARPEDHVIEQSLIAMAAAHGYYVVKGKPGDVDALRQKVADLKARLDRVTGERNTYKARLDLVKEALKA